ncbi:hypothetical protein KKA47_01610 [bacterium]|nr:hypothetical protein [bacterium]
MEKIRASKLVFFTTEDIRRILNLKGQSSAVFCARAVKRGALIRLKRKIYIIPGLELEFNVKDKFNIANFISTPSYISLMTALSYYQISTQILPYTIESISLVRAGEYSGQIFSWKFWQTQKKYYCGFVKQKEFFIAEPEKAIIDIAQLMSFKKYAADLSSIDFDRFDWNKIEKMIKDYPQKTKNLINLWRKKYGRTSIA